MPPQRDHTLRHREQLRPYRLTASQLDPERPVSSGPLGLLRALASSVVAAVMNPRPPGIRTVSTTPNYFGVRIGVKYSRLKRAFRGKEFGEHQVNLRSWRQHIYPVWALLEDEATERTRI